MSGVLLWTAVALLGGAGSVLRFIVDEHLRIRSSHAFPIGILVVNVSASLLIGILAGATLTHDAALLASTAFVGAYSTFSTWMLDTVNAVRERYLVIAAGNVVVSLVLGLLAVWIGRKIGAGL